MRQLGAGQALQQEPCKIAAGLEARTIAGINRDAGSRTSGNGIGRTLSVTSAAADDRPPVPSAARERLMQGLGALPFARLTLVAECA